MTVESAVVEFREEQKKTNARLDAMQTDLLQICDQMGHLSQRAKDLCEMVERPAGRHEGGRRSRTGQLVAWRVLQLARCKAQTSQSKMLTKLALIFCVGVHLKSLERLIPDEIDKDRCLKVVETLGQVFPVGVHHSCTGGMLSTTKPGRVSSTAR